MSTLALRKHIAAPLEFVFARATDLASVPDIVTAIQTLELLTPGPVGVGTRFRETRLMFGRAATEELEITRFDAPDRYDVGCENHGCRYHTEFHFRYVNGGTEVSMSLEVTPLTMKAKLMTTVMKPMLKQVAREMERDLDELKAAIEAAAARG